MYCQKCGAEIPDNSTFCRQCGAPVAGQAPAGTPAIFKNLLNSLKSFFSKKPENGIMIAAGSNTHEWSILLGTNVTLFMFAFAIIGVCLRFHFGFHLLFGLLIALVANGIMFGALFLLLTLMRKRLPFVGLLNLYAYTTIPLSCAALLSMPFAPAWHILPMLFFAIAILAQFLLFFLALQKAVAVQKASDGSKIPFHLFWLISSAALAVVFIASHWLNVAAVSAAIDDDDDYAIGAYVMISKYHEGFKNVVDLYDEMD